MRGLAKLTRIEAKVLFLRNSVVLLVALAVPIGILLVFGLLGFARDPAPELGGQRPIDTVLPSIALAISVRAPVVEPLTQRELEVLQLVARGATNREAARRLFISEASVKAHLLHVYAKLGVNDRAAAVATAYERGLLTPGGG